MCRRKDGHISHRRLLIRRCAARVYSVGRPQTNGSDSHRHDQVKGSSNQHSELGAPSCAAPAPFSSERTVGTDEYSRAAEVGPGTVRVREFSPVLVLASRRGHASRSVREQSRMGDENARRRSGVLSEPDHPTGAALPVDWMCRQPGSRERDRRVASRRVIRAAECGEPRQPNGSELPVRCCNRRWTHRVWNTSSSANHCRNPGEPPASN